MTTAYTQQVGRSRLRFRANSACAEWGKNNSGVLEHSTIGSAASRIFDSIAIQIVKHSLVWSFKREDEIVLFNEKVNARKCLADLWLSDLEGMKASRRLKFLFAVTRYFDASSLCKNHLVNSWNTR